MLEEKLYHGYKKQQKSLNKKLYYGYKKQQKPLNKKKLARKNIKGLLNDLYISKIFKRYKFNFKKYDEEKFDIFFKLLFLIPNKQVKLLKNLLKKLKYLRLDLQAFLFSKITRIFRLYYKNYLKNLIKNSLNKGFKSNIFLFRLKSSFYHLEFNKKKKTGLLYLKFPKVSKKKRITALNNVSLKKNIDDFNFYKAFFLASSRLKWRLINWRRIKKKDSNLKKWTRKWVFVFPFLITIKPCTIIIKNVFFKTFFVISKWFRSSKRKEDRFLFGKRIKKVFFGKYFSLFVSAKKNKSFALDNYTKIGSYFIWHILQKYYYYLNNNILLFSFKRFNFTLLKDDIFIRKLSTIKKIYRDSRLRKRSNKRYWKFLNVYKNQWYSSFIGLSFFLRLYSLYFFWFLYFFNKLFYYFNKVVFNLWFRFFYFISLSINVNDSTLFFNYRVLYRNLNLVYYLNPFFEFENIFSQYLLNINNIWFVNMNLTILKNLNSNFYKNYYLLMFFFFYKNYFLLNIYYNYNKYLMNIRNKTYRVDNEIFDMLYKDNYSYKVTRNPQYFWLRKRLDLKYPGYFEKDVRKYRKMSENAKLNYMQRLTKRQSCLFLK